MAQSVERWCLNLKAEGSHPRIFIFLNQWHFCIFVLFIEQYSQIFFLEVVIIYVFIYLFIYLF